MVEEKRSLIEVQVREELYGTANQPTCIGKKDEQGNWLFPVKGALDPNDVAICIGERLLRYGANEALAAHVARLKEAQKRLGETQEIATRTPYFCSGCPHNSSTVVPEGMRAYAGIGCHYMAQWMDRSTLGFTQMGGEGANWIGEAPFSKRSHVFQNLGDGTYNHSGYMAIRASVAAGVNITYKILFNDAVAMTGGQRNDGGLTVPMIARQVAAEGAKKIVVVTDEPKKYPRGEKWPSGLTIHHRDDLMQVQASLAAIAGVTVLIYDQTCAAEKRRRRKRGAYPDPGQAGRHQRSRVRGLRRLRGEVELRVGAAGRDRVRPQAPDRPVELQQGLFLHQGVLPVLRHVEGAKLKKGQGVAEPASLASLLEPRLPSLPAGGTYSHHRHRHRRHRHRHHRRHPGDGGASRRQGLRHHRHGGPGAEGRRGVLAHPHRRALRGHPRHPRRRWRAPTWCSAATWWSPAPRRCWRRSSRAPRR